MKAFVVVAVALLLSGCFSSSVRSTGGLFLTVAYQEDLEDDIFVSGFETGDVSEWSYTVGVGTIEIIQPEEGGIYTED